MYCLVDCRKLERALEDCRLSKTCVCKSAHIRRTTLDSYIGGALQHRIYRGKLEVALKLAKVLQCDVTLFTINDIKAEELLRAQGPLFEKQRALYFTEDLPNWEIEVYCEEQLLLRFSAVQTQIGCRSQFVSKDGDVMELVIQDQSAKLAFSHLKAGNVRAALVGESTHSKLDMHGIGFVGGVIKNILVCGRRTG